ncbi:uncharacterized protein [Epargyreus clarus]|uniref:uncharacterized protein isoform X3 n=1 Tax=Epargyreus clarus TaxID=520877 RepID=UPI003C305C3A
MSNRAWVTLATNDSYGLGALVLVHSLRRARSAYPAVVLITPSVTEAMRNRLRAVFAEVVIVDVLDSKDAAHLALLQRPELGITFTKIHCWNLTQYEKCVFLDADTLIVQNCDELFEREEFSAAPDVGWPDCFNSGVFVFKPSAETFASLIKFAQERGSFDGGDQGLLNSYFSDWAHGDINKHLPFLYNVTSAAFYSYLPALKHYGQNLKVIHFIGATKPWLQQFNWETRTSEAPQHLRDFLQLWWDIFVGHVHCVLEDSMVEIEEALPAATSQEGFHAEPRLDSGLYEPILDPESEFPWHHPDAQIPYVEVNVPEIDVTQYHDPWDIYRGHIPPSIGDSAPRQPEFKKAENHEELRKYAWDYVSPQHHQTDIIHPDVQNIWQPENSQQNQVEHFDHSHHDFRGNLWEYNPHYNYSQDQQYSQNHQQPPNIQNHQPEQQNQHQHSAETFTQHTHHTQRHQDQYSEHTQQDNQPSYNYDPNLQLQQNTFPHAQNDQISEYMFQKDSENVHYPTHQQRVEYTYYVHHDHEKARGGHTHNTETEETETESKINGYCETDCEVFENLRPRHPYDGFYLRHRMTIDSQGKKICTHEVPPTPTPSPPESPTPMENSLQLTEEDDIVSQTNAIEDQTGVAGNLARVVLGAGAQREALDDLTRRQGWEAGNIDYMGADAFDNIWAKISQTLSQPRSPSPKQSTPPPQPPAPAAPVEDVPRALETSAVNIPEEIHVAAPAPVPEIAADLTLVAPVETPKLPESPALPEAPAEIRPPTPINVPEPAVKAPSPAAVPVAAPEPAKVVAAAAPTKELKPAAPAEVPAAEIPVATPPAEPEKPSTIPSKSPEPAKKIEDAVSAVPPKVVSSPAKAPAAPSKPEVTPEKGASTTDSPPLANTPSKEEVPIVSAAKSTEEAAQETRL